MDEKANFINFAGTMYGAGFATADGAGTGHLGNLWE